MPTSARVTITAIVILGSLCLVIAVACEEKST